MKFSRQEYRSGLPFPSPGELPNPGIKSLLCLLHWQADYFPLVPPGSPYVCVYILGTLEILLDLPERMKLLQKKVNRLIVVV